jgi:hypothetical protein
LCRIARYEQAEPVAKHAAVAVIGQKLLPGTDEKQRAQQIVGALGGSQRPGSRWLRAYAEAARGAAEIALAARSAEEVSAALRETVGEFIDVRLLDPSSALPGRGRVGSLRPQ